MCMLAATCMCLAQHVPACAPPSISLHVPSRQEAVPPDGLPEGEEPQGGSATDDPEEMEVQPEPRRVGGALDVGEQDPLRFRVLLDGSVCEVFTSTGSVLSIRVNR